MENEPFEINTNIEQAFVHGKLGFSCVFINYHHNANHVRTLFHKLTLTFSSDHNLANQMS